MMTNLGESDLGIPDLRRRAVTQLVDYAGRTVNHVATFYQPGEQYLAIKVYEALGCRVSDTTFGEGNQGLIIHVEPDEDDLVNNVIYAAEVSPVQWQFEQELRRALGEREALASAFATYGAQREHQPESVTHFGIRHASFATLKSALKHLEQDLDSELQGRLKVAQVSDLPAGTAFLTEDVISAFVVTDVIAAGLLTLGQTIELQAQQPATERAASP
jgi:hypothetical protein